MAASATARKYAQQVIDGSEPTSMRSSELTSAGYSPVKATIVPVDPSGDAIECQFNPNQISYSKSTNWKSTPTFNKDIPLAEFGGGQADKLSMKLYFDTSMYASTDVRTYLGPLIELTRLIDSGGGANKRTKPPLCRFMWGTFSSQSGMSFQAYLDHISVTFSMFLPDGTPIRAEADVSFVSVKETTDSGSMPAQNPTSISEARKLWVVSEGETLDWIAYKEYSNSSHWRHIAQTNNLHDPMNLKPGTVLRLTPLD
jgi:nucleoid-associated protein YgaU